MILTDELLLSYQRCPRRTFLDICGDWTQIQTPSDFVLKLRRDSRIHQQTVASGQIHHQPNHSRRDWQSGVGGTLELMQMGVERIYQGVLTADGGEGVTLLSRPDLLVKQSGKSKFGDWIYVPTSIKLGKRSKPEYKVEAAFQAYVLANIQGVLPPTAWLVLRERRNYAVNLDQWLPQMQLVVQNCLEMLRSQAEPEVFISRQ